MLVAGTTWAVSSQAQISSVTRRTIQHPAGGGYPANQGNQNAQAVSPAQSVPPILSPQPAQARTVVPVFVPPSPPKSDAEKVAEQERVVEFERQCAEKGMASFQYSLGMRYLVGNGVEQDVEKGRKLLEKASAQGEGKARQRLTELDKLLTGVARKNDAVPNEGKKPVEQEPPAKPTGSHPIPSSVDAK
jgi:TPR repeat protein